MQTSETCYSFSAKYGEKLDDLAPIYAHITLMGNEPKSV